MTTNSGVSWTHGSAPVVTGCDYSGPGCRSCFAVGWAWRFSHHPSVALARRYEGTVEKIGERTVWTGRVRFNEDVLLDVLSERKAMRWFLSRDGDICHEAISDLQLAKIFALPALKPQDTFIFLTKRTHRLAGWSADTFQAVRTGVGLGLMAGAVATLAGDQLIAQRATARCQRPLPNVWLGFSAEDQVRFDERWADMRRAASLGWNVVVSLEPLLGPLRLPDDILALGSRAWVIVGGESGPRARGMHLDWVRTLRDQCLPAGVLFHLKQQGALAPVAAAHTIQHEIHRARPSALRDHHSRCEIVWPDGRRVQPGANMEWWIAQDFGPVADTDPMSGVPILMRRVGAKAAGYTLDGAIHRDVPPMPDAADLVA